MRVEQSDDPARFLVAAEPLLLEDEARHNLILGIAGTLRDHREVYREHRLWVVYAASEAQAAALRTPPFNFVLARPRSREAVEALADHLWESDPDVPGVTAAVPEVDAFADAWEARSGRPRLLRMRQRLYRLTELRPPRGVSGRAREATEADRALLVAWLDAFSDEALADVEPPTSDSERWVDARLRGAGGFLLWEDGGAPVSLAGWGGRAPNGVRIGPVYTPPEHRRRGYGSAVTAAASADRLSSGSRFCFLYTDLANPTSNRIYVDIGYEPVCDSLDYAFEKR